MKKQLIFPALFIILGMFIGFFISERLQNKTNLKDTTININKDITVPKTDYVEEQMKKYIHPIEQEEINCLANSTGRTSDSLSCLEKANVAWNKEIQKYLNLLKITSLNERYKLIINSQQIWEKQKESDIKIITSYISEHGGSMYRELAADDINNILKNRALFLKYIYDIHTDQEVDNYNISNIQ